jgi:hypothetical protein
MHYIHSCVIKEYFQASIRIFFTSKKAKLSKKGKFGICIGKALINVKLGLFPSSIGNQWVIESYEVDKTVFITSNIIFNKMKYKIVYHIVFSY